MPGHYPLTGSEKALFARHNVTIYEVPYMMPPNTSTGAGGCAPTDLMRIHAFSFTQYDAVAYFDGDVTLMSDIRPMYGPCVCVCGAVRACVRAMLTSNTRPMYSPDANTVLTRMLQSTFNIVCLRVLTCAMCMTSRVHTRVYISKVAVRQLWRVSDDGGVCSSSAQCRIYGAETKSTSHRHVRMVCRQSRFQTG